MLRKRTQLGFTFVELCMAMVVTTLVLGAMSAFSLAMVSAWKQADQTQAMTLSGQQAVVRLENEIRNAKLVGACIAGSSDGSAAGAAIMLWKQDTNSDGYIQSNEVEMIIHDTTSHAIYEYPIGTNDGNGTWSYSTKFTSTATFNTFKSGHPSTLMIPNVYGAVFSTAGAGSASRNPTVEFALKLQVNQSSGGAIGGGQEMMVNYGSATVRAPLNAPGN